ncbi:ferritin family protein [Streptomyces sp. 4N509B]|uniref:ferritin family protein n=1 Tax=Streptomyces sp. 4N509B TaxID=3457413 RepID=UPI003FD09444
MVRHLGRVLALTGAVLSLTAAAPLSHALAEPAHVLALGTVRDAQAALRGEAFANASYGLFAAQAEREDLDKVAGLFRATAEIELGEHFTELADLLDYVGGDEANLRHAIDGETHEALSMYPTYAEEARQDGDLEAAELFTEIAGDETEHRRLLTIALEALTTGEGRVPAPPQAEDVEVPAGLPEVASARTLDNLEDAMHGEALAHASYLLFAQHAAEGGRPRLAALFEGLAAVEVHEHFAEEAQLAGLVSDTPDNLRTAIAGEHYEAEVVYPTYAARAEAAGDGEAAALFTEIAGDEADHAARFEHALRRVT